MEDNILKIKAGIYRAFSKIWDYIKKGVLKALSIEGVVQELREVVYYRNGYYLNLLSLILMARVFYHYLKSINLR
jgi:dolichyl-phosphate-mannose--protein O-mannosyl transferase